jgi:UDP-N-acetyl-D-mannosaminuronic acid transferase (WecB/TagA/CpsF family)
MALKKKGFNAAKIPGVELWHDISEKYYKEKSFCFIGAPKIFLYLKVEFLNRLLLELKRIGRQLKLLKFFINLQLGKY